eukprot:16446727-Heterocapsa_arctica.AAC.1
MCTFGTASAIRPTLDRPAGAPNLVPTRQSLWACGRQQSQPGNCPARASLQDPLGNCLWTSESLGEKPPLE